MNQLVVVFAFAMFFGAQAATPTNITKAWDDATAPFRSLCMCEVTGVKEDVVLRSFPNSEFPNDACLKCYLDCLARRLKLYTTDGKIDVPAWVAIFVGLDMNVALGCADEADCELDPCQKAYNFITCIYKDQKP